MVPSTAAFQARVSRAVASRGFSPACVIALDSSLR